MYALEFSTPEIIDRIFNLNVDVNLKELSKLSNEHLKKLKNVIRETLKNVIQETKRKTPESDDELSQKVPR